MKISILDTRISPPVGFSSKDHCLLYHLLDGAALGHHIQKFPFLQFYFKSGVVYIYTPYVFPQGSKIMCVIMGKQHFMQRRLARLFQEAIFVAQVWHMNKFCPNPRHVMFPAFMQDILHFFHWNAESHLQTSLSPTNVKIAWKNSWRLHNAAVSLYQMLQIYKMSEFPNFESKIHPWKCFRSCTFYSDREKHGDKTESFVRSALSSPLSCDSVKITSKDFGVDHSVTFLF